MVVAAEERRLSFSFWQVHLVGWAVFYVLLLLAALPRLGERDIFRYNTLACATLFCAGWMLRPVCRRAAVGFRKSSRLTLEAGMFALCLPLGSLASLATGLGTFGWHRLNGSNGQLSWLQCAFALFLWCHLYLSMRSSQSGEANPPNALPVLAFPTTPDPASLDLTAPPRHSEIARRFMVRTGSRIEVVLEEAVLWFSAAGDYVELHTATGTHLVRETMRKLHDSLDPVVFVRIHRSRIVRWSQIRKLVALENGEYRVSLKDGSEHRASRTYAPMLTEWLSSDRTH